MRRFRAINLIVFCAFVLFVDDNSVTEAHGLKNYFRNLLSSLKTLRHGILPGNTSFFAYRIIFSMTKRLQNLAFGLFIINDTF